MRQLEDQKRHAGAEREGDDGAVAILAALPSEPIDPVLAAQVLRAARTELDVAQSRWKRAELFFARVLVPAALVACAAGWAYHFIAVAQLLYASH
ncbi:MAG TPA: hypothetical protein VJN18_09985 [Polyangiaceae bacterium]|nr:hypothetical protein [Polyangiaceae bacterium]